MTPTQEATVAAADHVLNATVADLAMEPPACLREILDVLTEHLTEIHEIGIGWKIIQLEIMKGKLEKEEAAKRPHQTMLI